MAYPRALPTVVDRKPLSRKGDVVENIHFTVVDSMFWIVLNTAEVHAPICVAISAYSSRGSSACDGSIFPDLVAPGMNIETTGLFGFNYGLINNSQLLEG